MADGIAVRETDESVGKYLEWYIENIAKIKNQPTTIYGYKKMMEKHILPALGGIKLKNLSAQQIQEYIPHKQRELSANPVIKHVDFLRICFDKAVDMGKLKINPASRVTCPHKVKYHVQPYTAEQVVMLIRCLSTRSRWVYILLTVAAYTGLRRGELMGLLWSDIDFERKNVASSDGVRRYYYPHEETGCYASIVNSSNTAETGGNIYKYMEDLSRTNAGMNIAKAYFTALGRERYSMYKTNNNPEELISKFINY